MSTHDPGAVYLDWRKIEAGITALEKELAMEQVSHPLADYTPERTARLWEQIEAARRWTWPQNLSFNV